MFGDQLKLARKKEGYSLRGLSEAIGGMVSAQAISKYERGQMMPGIDVLMRLSDTLGVTVEFLLSKEVERLEEVEFSRPPNISAKGQAKIEAAVIDNMQRYLAIEQIMGIDSMWWKAPPWKNRSLSAVEEGEQLAKDMRAAWKLGTDAIPDMTALLEDQGIKVLVLPLPKKAPGLTASVCRPDHKDKVPIIVVNKNETLERRRLMLAYELAHRVIAPNSNVDHEKAAGVFARAFLIPKAHVIGVVGNRRRAFCYREIIHLKHKYRVTAGVLLARLYQLELISQLSASKALRTFTRNWHKEEPEPLEPPGEEGRQELPRRLELLSYRAFAEELITIRKLGDLTQQSYDEVYQDIKWPEEAHANRTGRRVNRKPRRRAASA